MGSKVEPKPPHPLPEGTRLTLSQWERGLRVPPSENVRLLARRSCFRNRSRNSNDFTALITVWAFEPFDFKAVGNVELRLIKMQHPCNVVFQPQRSQRKMME